MGLRIHGAPLIGRTVEVDGKARDHGDRGLEIDERVGNTIGSPKTQATRQGELTIEPRIQQGAAVHLHAQLQIAVPPQLGARLGLEAGAVGVCTDQPQPRRRRSLASLHESDQRRAAATQEIATTGLQ